MPYLTPNAERALYAFLEDALFRAEAQHISPCPLGNPYAPLDFNAPTIPDLPDWYAYNDDDFDHYAYV